MQIGKHFDKLHKKGLVLTHEAKRNRKIILATLAALLVCAVKWVI